MTTWPRHIGRFGQQYDKASAKYPLFRAELIDRIHKSVQVLLYSCNMTSIEDVESGALEDFGGLHKKLKREEWSTKTLVWVDRHTPKEEGRQKLDIYGIRSRMSNGGGGRYLVHNIGVDPQLRLIERIGELISAAHSEKLCCPMVADGREIFLQYYARGKCVRQ